MSPNFIEKATFGRSWDPKVVCLVTLALVFLCGAAAGGVVMNFGLHNRLHQPSFDTAAGKELFFAERQWNVIWPPPRGEQRKPVQNFFWQYSGRVLSKSRSRGE